MAALSLRPANPGDAAAIAAIWSHWIEHSTVTFTTAPKTAQDIAGLIAAQPVLCAVEDDRLLGFATYAAFRSGPGYARTMEHSIHLAPEARGRGTGSRLLVALETRARAAGHHSLIAGLSAENPGAIAFHHARGFAEVGRIAEAGWKFGRWIDLVLMQKLLPAPS